MNRHVTVFPHQPVVVIEDSQAYTNTLHLARYFGKEHRKVCRDIETILENLKKLGIPEEFSTANFGRRDYVDSRGKVQKMYRLSEVAFYLTAMGFTGPEALRFKMAYVGEFERMKEQLNQLTDKRYIALLEEFRAISGTNRGLYEENRALNRQYIERFERKPARPVSQWEHDHIVTLKSQGLQTARIAEKTGWSSSTVCKHVRLAREAGEVPPMTESERLKVAHLHLIPGKPEVK